ncbi:Uncharacterized membrane protein YcfT [Cellulosimicrobium cellulans]|nr:acyltransferase [Sphaerisporangium cinnabarinum]PTU54824.1 acyltransferase [Sphaerisporangium cinnabarinum]SDF70881.1 Uncharacterized membrane protein YcfT [Cellulosimicrobium cellulans]
MPRQQPVERVRLRWPDAARGLAILLVVVLHATRALGDLDLTGAWGTVLAGWDRVNAALGTMRMPLFFAVAGLFAGKWVRGPWRALLASKVALFAWLLLLWPFVRALGYLLGAVVAGDPDPVHEALVGLELPPGLADDGGPAVQVGAAALSAWVWPSGIRWFLWALAVFFVVAKLLSRLSPRVQLVGAAAVSLAAFAFALELPNNAWDSAPKYFVFFLGGLLLRDRVLGLAERLTVWTGAAVVALWVAGCVLAAHVASGVLLWVVCVLGVAAGIVLGVATSGLRPLRALGTRTLPVYLTHMLVIHAILLVGGGALDAVPAPVAALAPPVLALVATLVSVGVYAVVSRTPVYWLYELPRGLARRLAGRPAARPETARADATP